MLLQQVPASNGLYYHDLDGNGVDELILLSKLQTL